MKQVKTSLPTTQLAVVIPTYNEAQNIKRLLPKLAAVCQANSFINMRVFIVDDSSPDNTADVAEQTAKKLNLANFKVQVVSRQIKEGLGKAYMHGFRHVLSKHPSTDYLLQMDADLSHDPKYIPALLELALSQSLDLVIGSRYVNGGGAPDWTLKRRLLSRGGNFYARLFLDKHIHDYTGGYNLFAVPAISRLELNNIHSNGYGFLIELKYRATQVSPHIAEIPIVFKDRSLGSSKMPVSTAYKTLILVPRLRLGL